MVLNFKATSNIVLQLMGALTLCSGHYYHFHEFYPPPRLFLPIQTNYRQINSASPQDPYPDAAAALTLPQMSMSENATDIILEDIKVGLQYVFQTNNNSTYALIGSGRTAGQAILDNLIEEGDRVLVLSAGFWGDLIANMSRRLGANVILYNKQPGLRYSLEEIELALRIHRPAILGMVMGESDSTVEQPMDGIGDICIKYGALLVVDVVAVLGIQPILMDRRNIDAVYASSSKGLGSVAGLGVFSLSERAINKIKNRTNPPRNIQTDLEEVSRLWNTSDPTRLRGQTLSLSLLYALREALATIVTERIENTYFRHETATAQLTRGLVKLGLEHFVSNPEDRMIGITSMHIPKGKDVGKIAAYIFKNFNIEISTGFGPTRGQMIRIATFASNADPRRVANVLTALKFALQAPETKDNQLY